MKKRKIEISCLLEYDVDEGIIAKSVKKFYLNVIFTIILMNWVIIELQVFECNSNMRIENGLR